LGVAGYAAYLYDRQFANNRRDRRHACQHKYVRRAKDRYQVRVWVGPAAGDDVNLGLYDSEWAAGRVVKLVASLKIKGPITALSLWQAVRPYLGQGLLPENLLPRHVYRRSDGRYGARARRGERRIEVGPFKDPVKAHRAIVAALAA